MKKVFKLLAAVGLMVAVSATSVSAAQVNPVNRSSVTTASVTTSSTAITPNNMTTGFEKTSSFPVHKLSYSKNNRIVTRDGNQSGVVIPIKIPANGQLFIDFSSVANNATIGRSGSLELYSDAACTSRVSGGYRYISSISDLSKPLRIVVPKGQTYYLTYSSSYSDYITDYKNSISFRTYFYSGADRTLSSGKWIGQAEYDSSKYRFYKINMTASGHIKVEGTANQTIALCNSKKTPIYNEDMVKAGANAQKLSYYLNKGTYYIRTKGCVTDVSSLRYTAYKLGSSPYVLTNKKTLKVSTASGAYQYLKYKATATGYISVSTGVNDSLYAALCNSSRKALTKDQWIYGAGNSRLNHMVYGVKKGQTYYVRIKSSDNPVSVKVTQTTVKEKSGSSKKKAVSVKAKKTAKGTIQAGSSAADWYKFKLTKAKKVTMKVKGSSNDTLKLTVYASSGRQVGATSISGNGVSSVLSSYGKMSKGTYYVKVQRSTKTASGYYSFSWK